MQHVPSSRRCASATMVHAAPRSGMCYILDTLQNFRSRPLSDDRQHSGGYGGHLIIPSALHRASCSFQRVGTHLVCFQKLLAAERQRPILCHMRGNWYRPTILNQLSCLLSGIISVSKGDHQCRLSCIASNVKALVNLTILPLHVHYSIDIDERSESERDYLLLLLMMFVVVYCCWLL